LRVPGIPFACIAAQSARVQDWHNVGRQEDHMRLNLWGASFNVTSPLIGGFP